MVLKGEIPPKVWEQLEAFEARKDSTDRTECEQRYPDLLRYIRSRVLIIDLIKDSGFEVEPLSPDTPGVYIARGACPCCGGND